MNGGRLESVCKMFALGRVGVKPLEPPVNSTQYTRCPPLADFGRALASLVQVGQPLAQSLSSHVAVGYFPCWATRNK